MTALEGTTSLQFGREPLRSSPERPAWATTCFASPLPTLIGTTIGGVSLVAILNHASVQEEIPA